MAAHFESDARVSRRRSFANRRSMAEINMTPFIDVILVLLIVFMVSAPLLVTGVAIDLPATSAKRLQVDQKPVTISIDSEGVVYLMDVETSLAELPAHLATLAETRAEERVYVRGADSIPYGRVANVLAILRQAGFSKTALVNRPQSG